MTNEMTVEEAVNILKSERDNDIFVLTEYREKLHKALAMAIQALEQQPSEDCISRQKALNCFEQTNTRQGAKHAIETLPSVTPERPKGKWMECGGDEPWLKGYCCSLCNFTTTQKYDYCTCGAKMEVNADDGDSN